MTDEVMSKNDCRFFRRNISGETTELQTDRWWDGDD